MNKSLHCRRPRLFHSQLPSAHRLSNVVRVSHLESELDGLVPVTDFHLGSERLAVMIRGLTSPFESLSTCPEQQIQDLVNEQERDEDLEQRDHFAHTAVTKRSKTNSERGRAFRARRKKYENGLQMIVNSLRQEVRDLDFLQSVRANKALRSRNSMDGSLVRLVREYFALFERGMPSLRTVGQKRPALLTDGSRDESFAAKQKAFLESAMDSEMQFSGASGRDYLLDQWKKYTSYHSSLHVDVVSIDISGEENNPIVTASLYLRVVFSHATFDHVFPHVADNKELVNKFIGLEVIYHSVNRLCFSPTGQILVYNTNVGFIDALVQAGANVSDIALLMQQARIADECRLGDEGDKNSNQFQELKQDNQDEITSPECYASDATSVEATSTNSNNDNIESNRSDAEEMSSLEPTGNRFAIDFLLS